MYSSRKRQTGASLGRPPWWLAARFICRASRSTRTQIRSSQHKKGRSVDFDFEKRSFLTVVFVQSSLAVSSSAKGSRGQMGLGPLFWGFLERRTCKQLQSKTLVMGRKCRGRGLAEARIISRLVLGWRGRGGGGCPQAVSPAHVLSATALEHRSRVQ